MKENSKSASGKSGVGWLIFFAGFVIALVGGWVVFPNLLYSQKAQPFNFSHAAHQDSTCEDCHYYRADGSYTGIPKMEKCKECHESQQGQTEDERILVEEYVQKDREIPWHSYSWQPDNVHFSHAPHKGKGIECVTCHRDVTKEEKMPAYKEDRITGYSRNTMKMDTCEKCHAERGVTNSCQMCHQ